MRPFPPSPSSAAERRKGKDMHFVHLDYRNCGLCRLESFMFRQWSVNTSFFFFFINVFNPLFAVIQIISFGK